MERRRIYSDSRFEELAGYARAVVDGDWIFVSGTSGHEQKSGTISDDVAAQTRQSLKTIRTALAEAGAGLDDVVRIRVYVSDRAHIVPVSGILKETFDHCRPTNTTVVVQLAEDPMKVELEVTALRRHAHPGTGNTGA
ncbi:MAG: RidA family protein [Inquilinus sp.]|nr:RidA family protein [Inquilinus sp.]